MSIALICHGGAGDIRSDRHEACLDGVCMAAERGYQQLESGLDALAVVESVVRDLEDHPQFNAGHGSALNADGEVVTDAAIMCGNTARVGSVGAVQGLANPVSLARAILEDGRHALLVADGAEAFARKKRLPFCDPKELIVDHERERWEEAHGTVGCVAVDDKGHLAVATSTGGVLGKLNGRLGDTPLTGCGFWADETMAVTCTGQGEAMIRTALAHRIAQQFSMAKRQDLEALAQAGIAHMADKTGGQGGVILVDRTGTIGLGQNTERMPVCGIGRNGRIEQV